MIVTYTLKDGQVIKNEWPGWESGESRDAILGESRDAILNKAM